VISRRELKTTKIDKLVADVIGLIDHFGAQQAAIVGHDWVVVTGG
jgi:pimeloyl-ACP methyl ester carboxylesterase